MKGRRLIVSLALGVAAAVVAYAPEAHAGEPREIDTLTKGQKVVKRGRLGAMKGRKISIAGQKSMTVGQVADLAFSEDRAMVKDIKKGRAALLADPVVEDEVVELEDATVLTTTTKFTVVDPDKMRQVSKTFARARARHKAAPLKAKQLSKQAKSDFAAYKKDVAKLPTNHPMKKALAQGDDALLAALEAGKGDFEVSTTVVIPKHAPKRDSKGRVIPPKASANGSFEYGSWKGSPVSQPLLGVNDTEVELPPETSTKGTSTHTAKFVAGFSEGDSWVWVRRWDAGSAGFFRIKAKAWYDFGLRVPMKIKGTLDPKKTNTKGSSDEASEFSVQLSADTLNAGADWYRDVGMASGDIHGGKELVLRAGFQVIVTLNVIGFNINKTIPKSDGFNFSQDFTPPFGNCGTKCGFDVWIPSDITRTQINLGVVKGSVRAGVNVSGKGEVSAAYEAMYGKDVIKSWAPGGKSSARKKERITFSKESQVRTRKSELAPLGGKPPKTKGYGYRLSEPRYDWKIVMTPGVRGDIEVKAKPVYSDTFTIGPLWLDALAIELGTVKLHAHPGSKRRYKVKDGVKTWKK